MEINSGFKGLIHYTAVNNVFLLIIFKQGTGNIPFNSQTLHFEQTHYSFHVNVMS